MSRGRIAYASDERLFLTFDGPLLLAFDAATLEPKPGVPPTSAHLANLVDVTKSSHAFAILRAAYQDTKPGDWLSEHTGVPAVTLPFTVGGDDESKDLFGLYDSTIAKLLAVAK